MTANAAHRIDAVMERASEALAVGRYFSAQTDALKALAAAIELRDFERAARICLPLQEARRQIVQLALDANARAVLSSTPTGSKVAPGLWLLTPPLLGIDGRRFRETAHRRETPVLALTREPTPRSGPHAGKVPIVGVSGEFAFIPGPTGMLSVRAYVAPPPTPITPEAPPDTAWFVAASEALGDAAIARAAPDAHPHDRVEDLFAALDAVPDHEKLHQALADACRAAMAAQPPDEPRRFRASDPRGF